MIKATILKYDNYVYSNSYNNKYSYIHFFRNIENEYYKNQELKWYNETDPYTFCKVCRVYKHCIMVKELE